MPLAIAPRADGVRRARPSRVRRRLTLLLTTLAVLVSTVGLGGPASAYEWNVLCTGYDTCAQAGYSNAGYPAHASTSYWHQSTGHNCTNYVAYRLTTNGMSTPPTPFSGNAYVWGSVFASRTDDAPAVGSIAWFGQSFSSTGHVAYVERVVSANQILVSEDNWGGDFRWRSITRSGGLWPDGFIHFKDQGVSTPAPISYRDYTPVTPHRIVDSRSGLGVTGRLGAGADTSVLVSGTLGLPRTAVGAVVLNVTAVSPSGAGNLAVYPSGASVPASSNINYVPGDTKANQVITSVGQDGRIRLRTYAATDVLVDVLGYYPRYGLLNANAPQRVLDTRTGLGAPQVRVPAGGRVDLQVAGAGGVPSSGAGSVILNTTAVLPGRAGFVNVWPTGSAMPTASSLNYEAGSTMAGLVVAKLGSGGKVSLYSSADTDLVVDVFGWLPTTADYVGLTPSRLLDTRNGTGPVAGGTPFSLPVLGCGGVPSSGVKAVMLTVVAVTPGGPGYVSAYPSGITRPTTSTVNYVSGQTIANSVLAPVGSDGSVMLYSYAGADMVVDVQGYVAN